MAWLYSQTTGEMFDADGNLIGTGYAGGGLDPKNDVAIACRNNPSAQNQHCMGPLPEGWYTFAEFIADHPNLGKDVIRLLPDPENEMFGRGGFFMHGDSIENPGFASDGCIVQIRSVRITCWESSDHRLQVVSAISN